MAQLQGQGQYTAGLYNTTINCTFDLEEIADRVEHAKQPDLYTQISKETSRAAMGCYPRQVALRNKSHPPSKLYGQLPIITNLAGCCVPNDIFAKRNTTPQTATPEQYTEIVDEHIRNTYEVVGVVISESLFTDDSMTQVSQPLLAVYIGGMVDVINTGSASIKAGSYIQVRPPKFRPNGICEETFNEDNRNLRIPGVPPGTPVYITEAVDRKSLWEEDFFNSLLNNHAAAANPNDREKAKALFADDYLRYLNHRIGRSTGEAKRGQRFPLHITQTQL
jgi:hypothetical protein